MCACFTSSPPRRREYFGEKVAIYYAWIGHYTYFLLIPAALGIAMEIVFAARG
jgi:hypothetical protein